MAMNKQKFRLESVLRYRKSIERKWQGEVAKTLADLLQQDALMNQALERRGKGMQQFSEGLSDGGLPAKEALVYDHFLQGIDIRIKQAAERKEEVRKVLEMKQKELLKAVKDRKAVDRLKKLHLENVQRDERTEERKQMDDIAGMHHGRKRVNG